VRVFANPTRRKGRPIEENKLDHLRRVWYRRDCLWRGGRAVSGGAGVWCGAVVPLRAHPERAGGRRDFHRTDGLLVHLQLRTEKRRALLPDGANFSAGGDSLVRLLRRTVALDESAIQQRSVHRYFANGRA
jgi:hypothetical protein